MNVCTIIARNYAAHARVLAESFKEQHPGATCSVLVIDDPDGYLDAAAEPFELLTLDQIGLPDPERMAAAYDVMELSTAVKPWLLRHLLQRAEGEPVAYLDPDIRVFDPLEEIDRRAREHDVVLTPHFTEPLPRDGLKPSEEDILIAGSYNLGFIALGGGETAAALLDWWSERLEKECLNDPANGHFVDQRWIDLAPGLWSGIDVLRSPAYNIAYWNLATRQLEDDGEGYRVDGEPLRFFHFSGFDPRRPTELSRHQNRIDVASRPALARICREYAEQLLEHGFEQTISWPYGWDRLPGGQRLDGAARRAYRDGVASGEIDEAIFTERGAERFVAFLKGSPTGPDANGALNRYAKALWESRPDFRSAFRDISGGNGKDFSAWLHLTAPDTGVAAELLPPQPGVATSPPPPKPTPGVNLVSYLSSERGVGEAARQVASALKAGNYPLTEIDSPTEPERIGEVLGRLGDAANPHEFNLICVNADMLPVVATALGGRFFEARHTTGLWFWEISEFPEQWLKAFDFVDEVWAASEHIAGALRRLSSKPVNTIRIPIAPAPPEDASRSELGLPDGFCFLFVFDYRSVFQRKNPLGLVEAFGRAFEPGEGPSLVIKSICGDEFPEQRRELAEAAADRPEIHLLEETVSVGMKNAMIAASDCYVSLHRSEGLGLTMAEAMYFSRPVIATAYSGNLDFMSEENSYLVDHTIGEVGPDADPYPPDAHWAEPDLDRAAALMREVYENPERAAARGERAAADIRRRYSPLAVGEELRERIDSGRRARLIGRLGAPAPAQAATGAPGGRYLLEHLLNFSEPPARAGAGRLRAAAKRGYLRLLRPYAAHQRQVDETIAESLDELREALIESLRMEAENDARLRALAELAADRGNDDGRG